MKKLVAFFISVSMFFSVFAADKTKVENQDGSVSIIAIDKDGSVKTKQKVDGFKDVTTVNGKKNKKLNPVTVDLSEFGGKEVMISLNCDVKITGSQNESNDIIWMINDINAGMPVLAQKKVVTGEWTNFNGEVAISLGDKKSLYISGSGLDKENMTIYLRNINVKLSGDGIGKNSVAPVNWMDAPSLAKAYEDYFKFGFATTFKGELNSGDGLLGIEHHVNSITMGNEFKPDFLFAWKNPNETVPFVAEDGNTYEMPANLPVFDTMDACLRIAKTIDAKVRGHVLVWHSQTPEWFFKKDFKKDSDFVDKAEMNARQEWYIKSVLEHVAEWEKNNYKDKRIVYTWDVVNEAIADGAGSQKWLRENSNWYKIYKDEEFIINAFRYANKYAPEDVLLVYNDYGCYSAGKRDAICRLVDEIKAAPDARIDAVGMQSHVKINSPAVTGYNSYEEAVKAFISHGVDVQVTELDIANGKNNYSSVMLKAKYKEYFKLFLQYRKTPENEHGITGVTIWGLTDSRTWLNSQQEYKGYTQYPLLFDAEWNVKPAFYGVLEALESVK